MGRTDQGPASAPRPLLCDLIAHVTASSGAFVQSAMLHLTRVASPKHVVERPKHPAKQGVRLIGCPARYGAGVPAVGSPTVSRQVMSTTVVPPAATVS